MALTQTTLTSDLSASDLVANLTSTTGFPAVGAKHSKQLVLIDGEFAMVDYVITSGVVKLMLRGWNGTRAMAHDVLSPVVTSSDVQDFPAMAQGAIVDRPPYVDEQISYGEDGAIAVPTRNTQINLTKATAGAYTLAAPTKAQDGVRLVIITRTAAAHVITATTLIGDGVSGSPHTTVTFAAFIGASIILQAQNGIWAEVGTKGTTVT